MSPLIRVITGTVTALVLVLGLSGCGGDDASGGSDPAPGDEASNAPSDSGVPSVDVEPAGDCTGSGEVTGDYEASFSDVVAFGSFVGDGGAYGLQVADGVALDVSRQATGEGSARLTGADMVFTNNGDGLTFADDGAGVSIDADLAELPAMGDRVVHVTAEITCP